MSVSIAKGGIALEEDKIDLTPMIDIVFLLLIYFLWTTDLTQESDISLSLPVDIPPDPDVQLPNEHLVDILASGDIFLNGVPMDGADSRSMPRLVDTLRSLKQTAPIGVKTAVTILAEEASLHQRTIDVLNACDRAEIKLVTFSD